MNFFLEKPETTILAFPLTGSQTHSESGKHRIWHSDEFIFVSAVDSINSRLVHGEKLYQYHFFVASQIDRILATDTLKNRLLLRNFDHSMIRWITQVTSKTSPAICLTEQKSRLAALA